MKHCCVDDPSHLCSINISGQGLTDANHQDFLLFDNVAYINAAENILPFDCFKYFPILRELEQPLNGLMNLKISPGDFIHLQMCDLSYNNLTPGDLLSLGLLPELRVLHATGNYLTQLPPDLAQPIETVYSDNYKLINRYPKLEILMLDDNKLSDINTFSALASLKCLKHLSLAKNNIYSVPHLMVMDGNIVKEQPTTTTPRKSSRKSSRRARSYMSHLSRQRSQIIKSVTSIDATDSTQVLVSGGKLVTSEGTNKDDKTGLSLQSNIEPQPEPQPNLEIQPKLETQPNPESQSQDELQRSLNLVSSSSNLGKSNQSKTFISEEKDKDDAIFEPATGVADIGLDEELLLSSPHDHYITDENAPLPFSHLQHLNLSSNKISEEEGLLAVAVWPVLKDLVIYDNPLTNHRSGDPPLLKRFLIQQFGIQITRLKPKAISKPHIEVPVKENRKVNTEVPRIPKVTVDEMLALEASLHQPALESTQNKEVLPPIKSPSPIPEEEDNKENAFFMTQVDEPDTTPLEKQIKIKRHKQIKGKRRGRMVVDERYQGYEEIIDLDDEVDECLPVPSDLNGNVKALQYALGHSLIYRDPKNVKLYQIQPPHRIIEKPKHPKGKPQLGKEEKIGNVLDDLRSRKTVLEEDLQKVLDNPSKYSKSFEEADQLLAQVQKKYNFVRTNSMHDSAIEARNFIEETKQMANSLKKTIDKETT